jgi:hypothetical protein
MILLTQCNLSNRPCKGERQTASEERGYANWPFLSPRMHSPAQLLRMMPILLRRLFPAGPPSNGGVRPAHKSRGGVNGRRRGRRPNPWPPESRKKASWRRARPRRGRWPSGAARSLGPPTTPATGPPLHIVASATSAASARACAWSLRASYADHRSRSTACRARGADPARGLARLPQGRRPTKKLISAPSAAGCSPSTPPATTLSRRPPPLSSSGIGLQMQLLYLCWRRCNERGMKNIVYKRQTPICISKILLIVGLSLSLRATPASSRAKLGRAELAPLDNEPCRAEPTCYPHMIGTSGKNSGASRN